MQKLFAVLSVILCLGGCVVAGPSPDYGPAPAPAPAPSPAPYGGGGMVYYEDAPVYIAAYPEAVFYQRYYGGCDCIMIVRYSNGFWYDHRGQFVHRGDWVRSRPTPRALEGHRTFMQQNRTTFHAAPPPGHRAAPSAPPMRPAVAAPAPQPAPAAQVTPPVQAPPPVQVSPPVARTAPPTATQPVTTTPAPVQPAVQAPPQTAPTPRPYGQAGVQAQPRAAPTQPQTSTQAQPQPQVQARPQGQAQPRPQTQPQAQPRPPRLTKCADGSLKASC